MRVISDTLKKIENFIPIFASFPTGFQMVLVAWFIVSIIVFLVGFALYYNEKCYVIKIMPDTTNTIIPYLNDSEGKEIILGLNFWPKSNLPVEVCLMNVEIFSEGKKNT